MLEELTDKQKLIASQTRDEWINLFFDNVKSQRGIDKPTFEKGIYWLYESLLKKEKPKIVYCDSWDDYLKTIWNSVWDSIQYSIFDFILDSILDSVRDSVWNLVQDSVWNPVQDSIWDSVWAPIQNSVRASVVRHIFTNYSNHCDIRYFEGVSFCDFFSKIGILKSDVFEHYREIPKSCPFVLYMYDNCVFAVQPPVYLGRNTQGRLHSTERAAVEFRDGSCYYFINGRSVPPWVIKEKELITREKFLSEKNAEIKGAIYEVLGQQGMMNLLGAETVHTAQIPHANGDMETVELLKTRDTFPETGNNPFAWVKVTCPSTGTNYLLGVEPYHTDAKAALASLSKFGPDEYSFNFRT
jgi:hypothetical protein